MKKRLAVLVLAGVMLALAACGKTNVSDDPGTVPAPSILEEWNTGQQNSQEQRNAEKESLSAQEQEAFLDAETEFAMRLFQNSLKEGENTMISPMSVLTALSMTANGAGGETAQQMLQTIGGGQSMEALNKGIAWWNSHLVSADNAKLDMANSIWLRENAGGSAVKEAFRKANEQYYQAKVSEVDFSDPNTVRSINDWVSEGTDGMIDEIVKEIPGGMYMYLINAAAFDAEWEEPYEPDDISEETFTTESGEEQTAELMFDDLDAYIEGDHVTGFVKPYAQGYSFVALLPEEGMSVRDYVKTLDGRTFRALMDGVQACDVETWLPKFTYKNEMKLNDVLAQMGMPQAFSKEADFSGITDTSALSIDEVLHKTFIEVDDKGTRAGAVTSVGIKEMAMAAGDLKKVRLDRPFVYAIVDDETSLPVFIGTLMSVE